MNLSGVILSHILRLYVSNPSPFIYHNQSPGVLIILACFMLKNLVNCLSQQEYGNVYT